MDFEEKIKPFFLVEHEDESVSLCLEAGEYKSEIFESRAADGFEGNGYDWASLALVFINEKMPDVKKFLNFDPEGGMFCIYSSNKDALKKIALEFKDACENNSLIMDLFSRAELD